MGKKRLLLPSSMTFLLLVVFCFTDVRALSGAQKHEPLSAKVTMVHDGDSVSVIFRGREERVRLIGIDAPELGQKPWGRKAKKHLEEILSRTGWMTILEFDVQERDKYVACIARVTTRQMGISELTDQGAWGAAMAVCQPQINDIQRCGNAYAAQTRRDDLRGCELLISGVLDDHYQSTGQYYMTVTLNGVVKFQGSARSVFSHGMPYDTVFSNWRILSLKVPDNLVREGNLSVGFQHAGSAPNEWIGIDYMELVCGGRRYRTEIGGANNYGVADHAAGIIYGGGTNGWTVEIPRIEPLRRDWR